MVGRQVNQVRELLIKCPGEDGGGSMDKLGKGALNKKCPGEDDGGSVDKLEGRSMGSRQGS